MSATIRELSNRIYSAWSTANGLYSKYAQALNIPLHELSFLAAVHLKEGQSQKEICDCYNIPKQTLNNTVKKLSAQGYIRMEVSAKDKREKVLYLTNSGKDYANQLLLPMFDIEVKVYQMVGSERLEQMVETNEHINLLLGKMFEEKLK